jgi:hypothetical protein
MAARTPCRSSPTASTTSSPSPRSACSGTTTNPNTPRPNPESDIEFEDKATHDADQGSPDRTPTRETNAEATSTNARASPSPSPNSSSSDAPSLGHIEPAWPKKVDATKISAQVTWGKGQSLPGLLFDIHWVPSSNKAFFGLRASVQLKNGPGRRRDGRTNVFLHIYPERIHQLSFETEPADKMLGHDTIALVFNLSRPPALVLPPMQCEAKNRASGNIITALFDLARQTSWTVYAAVPPRTLSAARIQKLCADVSEPSAGSIAVFSSAANLYQGLGGKIIEGDSLAPDTAGDGDPVSHEVHGEPPKYEESGSAPAYPALDKGKKRLRRGSSPEACSELKPPPPSDIESFLQSRLSALEQRFDEKLAAHKKEMMEFVGQAEARIMGTLRREMGEQSAEFEELLDNRVKEEVAELEETVMRNISEAPLRATLTFPDHPWY